MTELWHRLRAATTCRLQWHCRPSARIRKYDGGQLPALCCHCYRITGHGRKEPS
jgi:hypothetical protein